MVRCTCDWNRSKELYRLWSRDCSSIEPCRRRSVNQDSMSRMSKGHSLAQSRCLSSTRAHKHPMWYRANGHALCLADNNTSSPEGQVSMAVMAPDWKNNRQKRNNTTQRMKSHFLRGGPGEPLDHLFASFFLAFAFFFAGFRSDGGTSIFILSRAAASVFPCASCFRL